MGGTAMKKKPKRKAASKALPVVINGKPKKKAARRRK
jgi:hypothetical protein